jgi:NADH:ubiquinone oxidoreductase subunit 5 (subunit L)/multisubunit Na+/H+ antiporter MnhA subunit
MMTDWGLLFVAAASLPLLACGLLLLYRRQSAWITRGALVTVAGLSITGLVCFQQHIGKSPGTVPWTGSVAWLRLSQLGVEGTGVLGYSPDAPAVEVQFGYYVDSLTTVLFGLVSVMALLIACLARPRQPFAFHGVLLAATGFTLHLLIANNLVQLFLCWVLVGLLSTRLTGNANLTLQSFLFHRLGDAALLVSIAILWTYTGTLSLVTVREVERDVTGKVVLEDGQPKTRIAQLSIFDALRTPAKDSHDDAFAEPGAEAGKMCRVTPTRTSRGKKKLELADDGALVVIWNQETLNSHYDKPDRRRFDAYDPLAAGGHGKGLRAMPYWALCLAGVGIVMACFCQIGTLAVRQSTPVEDEHRLPVLVLVSAIVGTYLATRLFPAYPPEVCIILSYSGAVVAFLGAWAIMRQCSINRTLILLTVSQVGLAWAGLGIGAWEGAILQVSLLVIAIPLLLMAPTNSRANASRGFQFLFVVGALLVVGFDGIFPEGAAYTNLWSFVGLIALHVGLLVFTSAALVLTAAAMGRSIRMQISPQPDDHGASWHSMGYLAFLLVASVSVIICKPMILQSVPASAAEEGPLMLHEVVAQAAGGYFRTDSWLRPLHELTLIGPRGLAVAAGMVLLSIGLVWGGLRRPPLESFDPPASQASAGLERIFIRPLQGTAHQLASMEERLFSGLLQAGAKFVLMIGWMVHGIDRMFDGILAQLGRALGFLTGRQARRNESSLRDTSSV